MPGPMFKTDEVAPSTQVCAWIHGDHRVPRQQWFDECVANIYSRASDQCTGAHTDQNPLVGGTSDIVSLTLGSAAVFFWQPNPNGVLRHWAKKEAEIHARETEVGLWGCTPLLPGDLFLAAGTFQHHIHHGTLSFTHAANRDAVLQNWSVGPEAREVLQSEAYGQYFDSSLGRLPDRSVITLRRIENHMDECPERVANVDASYVPSMVQHFYTIAAGIPRPPPNPPPAELVRAARAAVNPRPPAAGGEGMDLPTPRGPAEAIRPSGWTPAEARRRPAAGVAGS
ncbi:hypothetical protein N9L68_05340 [bacterium]|nr:hypothetical protein [bacterium]